MGKRIKRQDLKIGYEYIIHSDTGNKSRDGHRFVCMMRIIEVAPEKELPNAEAWDTFRYVHKGNDLFCLVTPVILIMENTPGYQHPTVWYLQEEFEYEEVYPYPTYYYVPIKGQRKPKFTRLEDPEHCSLNPAWTPPSQKEVERYYRNISWIPYEINLVIGMVLFCLVSLFWRDWYAGWIISGIIFIPRIHKNRKERREALRKKTKLYKEV